MDEVTLIQSLTGVYQMLDQIKCGGHQNHRYLSASMDDILELIQKLRNAAAQKEMTRQEQQE